MSWVYLNYLEQPKLLTFWTKLLRYIFHQKTTYTFFSPDVVDKSHPKRDSQCIFSGFYQPQMSHNGVTIIATQVERPQSGTNTIIGADFMDW